MSDRSAADEPFVRREPGQEDQAGASPSSQSPSESGQQKVFTRSGDYVFYASDPLEPFQPTKRDLGFAFSLRRNKPRRPPLAQLSVPRTAASCVPCPCSDPPFFTFSEIVRMIERPLGVSRKKAGTENTPCTPDLDHASVGKRQTCCPLFLDPALALASFRRGIFAFGRHTGYDES